MLYQLTKLEATKPSPNFASGRGTDHVRAIVIHKSEGSFDSCISWFQNPSSQVSAHYVISLDGRVVCMVQPEDTAWHAGVVKDATAELYIDGKNPNGYTVGIELEGFAANGTPTRQLAALIDLLVDLCLFYKLDPDYDSITYHRHWDKEKLCPGAWVPRKGLISLTRDQMFAALAGKLPPPPSA